MQTFQLTWGGGSIKCAIYKLCTTFCLMPGKVIALHHCSTPSHSVLVTIHRLVDLRQGCYKYEIGVSYMDSDSQGQGGQQMTGKGSEGADPPAEAREVSC